MKKLFIKQIVSETRTIKDILRWTISRFNATQLYYGHGTDNSWDEAIQLILPSLFLPVNLPIKMYDACLTYSERMRVVKRVIRRIYERIPVPYLTNKAWFCGLELYVDNRVLIPRSPIGELITDRFRKLLPHPPNSILDMCTGSGCIAIACAYAYPKAEVHAVDIDHNALAVAKQNVLIHRFEKRITLMHSNLFNKLPPLNYDIIITNPPYVNEKDMNKLPAEYRAEPVLGLAAGKDGLKLVRRILAFASNYLVKDGILICEVGNSMVQLLMQYPRIPFRWLRFARGGEGVFMLTKNQLVSYQKAFKTY